MYKCDGCDREFKSASGLKRHRPTCESKEEVETTEEVVENEVVSVSKELGDNIIRKIAKLLDARKSTYDAQARHDIDLQIQELRKG